MKRFNVKKFNLIYSIFLSLYTIFLGSLFIIKLSKIYYKGLENGIIYSRDIVSEHLLNLIVPIILYFVLIIAGFVFSVIFKSEKKIQPLSSFLQIQQINYLLSEEAFIDENYEYIRKERKMQKTAKIIMLSINALCVIICSVYVFNINHFNKDGNLIVQALNMVRFILPWFIISVLTFIAISVFYVYSAKKELYYLKKLLPRYRQKKELQNAIHSHKKKNIIRCSILAVALCFIILGAINGGAYDVYVKAINICTECIGLG